MFKTLPGNFFTPLSSPNKTVYWECICKLYAVTEQQLAFGVERDVLADELQYYFEQNMAAELVEEEFASADSRGKANGVIRKLESCGWIETDTDKSYVQRVSFRDYSVKIIKTLLEIQEGTKLEYQGYIYTIYSLVRTRTENPGIVLMQIRDNTEQLITGLKNLSTGIKRYIDELTQLSTVAEIMDTLFNDYITNVVDKAYHRLLTSDNVSKFRPEIIEKLEAKSRSKKYVETAAAEIAEILEITAVEATERVYKYLHEIIEAFRNMDDILEEINRKNTQYQKSAVNRAKFRLMGNEDVRGQLKELLIGMGEEINRESMDMGGIYRISFLDDMIKLYSSSVIDEGSLYSPIEAKKEFKPQRLINETISEQERMEKLDAMAKKMQRILSPKKIEDYVMKQLGERTSMKASELPLDSDEKFIRMIYTRLYGQRKNMKYYIEPLGKIETEGFRFRDFIIGRKA